MFQTIFTDIDFVLHNYFESFLKAIEELYGLDPEEMNEKVKKVLEESPPHIEKPLQMFSEKMGLSLDQVEEAVVLGNNYTEHHHTPFSEELIYNYIDLNINHGTQIVAITARSNRDSADKLIKNIFPGFMNVPVICCDTPYKYLIIQNTEDAIYIEDHPKAVEMSCLNKNLKIIVPQWPWNRTLPKERNVYRAEHKEVSSTLKKLIQQKQEALI